MSIQKYAASLAALCAVTGVALADEAPSVTLRITPPVDKAHAERVYQRIERAAREVCVPRDPKDLSAHLLYERCVDEAVANAVAQVKSEALSQIHTSRAGSSQPLL
jgi:UrcA family protein